MLSRRAFSAEAATRLTATLIGSSAAFGAVAGSDGPHS
jgi:hypothetical protein